MKHAVFFLVVVVALAALVAITLSTAWAHDQHRQMEVRAAALAGDHTRGVDDSLGGGPSWKVRCPTVDGGTDVDMFLNVDGGTQRYNVTDLAVTSTSSTCVRVGLDSSVDSSHGIPIGAGCAGGTMWPPHTKVARCQSEGAAVVVDVTGGRP